MGQLSCCSSSRDENYYNRDKSNDGIIQFISKHEFLSDFAKNKYVSLDCSKYIEGFKGAQDSFKYQRITGAQFLKCLHLINNSDDHTESKTLTVLSCI
jgi:hypothetical protein